MDDINETLDGYVVPADDHVTKLLTFVRGWDRANPLVVHCYAGISRSTAGALVAACALNPHRNELAIAQGTAPTIGDSLAQSSHRGDRRSHARPLRAHECGNRPHRPRHDVLRSAPIPA